MKVSAADDRLTEGRFIYGMVLIGLALLQQKAADAKRKKHMGNEEDEPAEEANETANGAEAMVENITRAVAPVLLPMIEALGEARCRGGLRNECIWGSDVALCPSVEEDDFLARRRCALLVRVEFAVWHAPPETPIGREAEARDWGFDKSSAVHRV